MFNNIAIERSIVFSTVGDKRLRLDAYWHKKRLRRPAAPIFMYIHGMSTWLCVLDDARRATHMTHHRIPDS